MLIEDYLAYVSNVRRYSPRTRTIYADVLKDFARFIIGDSGREYTDSMLLESLTPNIVRSYEVSLMGKNKDKDNDDPSTVNLHLSVLSGFCKYLLKNQKLSVNPVKLVKRPKKEKRLPVFYRQKSMDEYFTQTDFYANEDIENVKSYRRRLARAIVSILYCTGIRRAELISLTVGSVDFSRNVMTVIGKGDKMREIPLVSSLSREISLYLQATELKLNSARSLSDPLLVTEKGTKLYPVYVDRVIKNELGQIASITGRKSPHVLRHTLATELLNNGADLNSIKELLGHSSLAATQVYTHNSIEKLKKVYNNAHPRAKSGGHHGD
jgi:integrase/recombinase XerC